MSNKEYFDDIAPQWDKLRETFFSEALREKAISAAGVQFGKIAADIGAGSGFITTGLIKKGLKVIAVDQSVAMVNEMKRKFNNVNLIDYRISEAENILLENESVDYVFANMFLHHVESPLISIKEMVRILKPLGILVITDLDEHNFKFLKVEHHDRWMGFKREDIRQWLIEAGLKDVKVDCANESCCALSSCGTENARISIFLALGNKKSFEG